jgi:hypothetical protein
MAQVMAVGSAKDTTAAVMALMGGDAGAKACGSCLIPCASAVDKTTCAMACTTSGGTAATTAKAAKTTPAAKVARRRQAGAATTAKAGAATTAKAASVCTMAQLMPLAGAQGKEAQVVATLKTSAPACGKCLEPCLICAGTGAQSCAMDCTSKSQGSCPGGHWQTIGKTTSATTAKTTPAATTAKAG